MIPLFGEMCLNACWRRDDHLMIIKSLWPCESLNYGPLSSIPPAQTMSYKGMYCTVRTLANDGTCPVDRAAPALNAQ